MSDAMRFFAIFFLTLGPLKTIPIFFVISQRMEPPQRWKLALRATGTATIIALAVAFGGYALIQRWGVSVPAVQLGGGILILIGAIDVIRSFKLREPPQSLADTEPHTPQEKRALARRISLSPLAVPTIVTSYGVVAILLAMSLLSTIGRPSSPSLGSFSS